MGDLAQARAFALSLPGTTEEPHFDMTSFRVGGKIFATAGADELRLHVFLDQNEVEATVAQTCRVPSSRCCGVSRYAGCGSCSPLLQTTGCASCWPESWRRKAPRRLVAQLDAGTGNSV